MNKTDLTTENLLLLINISNDYNCFSSDVLSIDNSAAVTEKMENIFLDILYHSNFGLYEIDEIKCFALDFIYNKKLNEMPLYLEQDHRNALKKELSLSDFQWVPIVARWRLYIGI